MITHRKAHRAPFPIPFASPETLGFDAKKLDRLDELIESHLKEGRFPGCQIALARHGKLALFKTYGLARTAAKPTPAQDRTLWNLYSITKVLVAGVVWQLVEEGRVSFDDAISAHIPEFAARNKQAITLAQVLTHQAGFPNQAISKAAWSDHVLMRREVCDFHLEWTPGSRIVYHPLSAGSVLGVLIEAITGKDFRQVMRERIFEPLGLENELYLGKVASEFDRVAHEHSPWDGMPGPIAIFREGQNTREWLDAGFPGGGAMGTARALTAFFQVLVQKGELAGVRLFSPRMIEYATRNHTGDRIDETSGMALNCALGPNVRGLGPGPRSRTAIASPNTFGHGGAANAIAWGDPDSGVSFAYLSNRWVSTPAEWSRDRFDKVCTIVHSAIL